MKFKIRSTQGLQTIFKPGEQGIQWLGLDVLRLEKGETWQGSFAGMESALVILSGRCSIAITAGDVQGAPCAWQNLGGRADVFSGLPTTVYAPPSSEIRVSAESKLEIAIGKAPATTSLPAVLIRPEDVKVNNAGIANWRRDVRMLVPPGSPLTTRLIIGETINPPGNWSGFPPHKHDDPQAGENCLEEFYLFKAKPADGFGVQLIYGSGEGETHYISSDDVTVMLNNYHPTVATPGTSLYYLWVLSGDSKAYDIGIDPAFRWLTSAEAVIREIQR
jgi:5-deoxy-glucuronate isomerase